MPGAHGIGKVHVILKPKPKGNVCSLFLGAVMYFIFFCLIFVSYSWSRPNLKYNIVLPLFKKTLKSIDRIKVYFSPVHKQLFQNANGFTLIHHHSEEQVLFEQGFTHAMERMYQMDIYRRGALGRLSEVLGDKTLYLDHFSRTLGFAQLAQQDYDALNETMKSKLQHYADGVNAYLRTESKHTLPEDFDLSYGLFALFYNISDIHNVFMIEPWTPVHTLSVMRLLFFEHSHGWEEELQRFTVELAAKYSLLDTHTLFDTINPLARDTTNPNIFVLPGLGGFILACSKKASSSGAAFLASSLHSAVRSPLPCTHYPCLTIIYYSPPFKAFGIAIACRVLV